MDAAEESERSDHEAVQLLHAANGNAKEDETDCNEEHSHSLSEQQANYNQILQQSCNRVNIAIAVTLIAPLMSTTRLYVAELYMLSLSPTATASSLSGVVFFKYAINAVASFLAAVYGDKYGHDKALLFVFVIDAIGIFTESMAGNLWLFIVGFYVTAFSMSQITMAYIAYLLPHKAAISYMSVLFALCSFVYLLGPLIAAVIVDYSSYRNVFWFNALLFALCILVILAFVLGSQRKLQSMQSTLTDAFVSQQQQDDIFPICNVRRQRLQTPHAPTSDWRAFFSAIGKRELVLLLVSMFQNCVCWAIEAIFLFYFTLFMTQRFRERHLSLMYLSGMVLAMTVCIGIAIMAMPKMLARIIPRNVWIVPVAAVLFASTITAAMLQSEHLGMYWLVCPVIGVCFGAMHMGTEMCILEMQPKQHSGKVSGAKEALKIGMRAFGILFVGLFWTAPDFDAFWMGQICCALVVFLLSFVVCFVSRRLK